ARQDDRRHRVGAERERWAVDADFAAEQGEAGAVEALLLEPADERGGARDLGEGADLGLVVRQQVQLPAEVGAVLEPLAQLLADQRSGVDEDDAVHRGTSGAALRPPRWNRR